MQFAFNRVGFPERGTWKPLQCSDGMGATIVCPCCGRRSFLPPQAIGSDGTVPAGNYPNAWGLECGYKRSLWPNVPCCWFAHSAILYPWNPMSPIAKSEQL